ncbi:SH3 domain-containing protein [Desmonostoc muscorum LEGE 12446]|uniref:SH3 domain-containing protein n=1 Tax=Desmonostoc muscorum LEGE 12446 TaxID=1828758 RepID=A0A8J7DBB1_DESMC|nr:SH3 domain-containing protein [Desmonostoc muscorum]MCF2149083.1 SH3 domain-containing protein [Desmonostoc muscorum LEGE 12446]
MSLITKLTAGLLTFGTLMTGVLPVMARPATLTSRSNLRTAASLTAPVEEILPSGANVEVLNITVGNDGDRWFYVQPKVEGTLSGWLRSDLVRFEVSNKRYATIAGNRGYKINVRSSPNLRSKVLYNALSGDLVTVEDTYKQADQYRWHRIKFPSNVTGWVREDLLSIWPEGCIITCPEY